MVNFDEKAKTNRPTTEEDFDRWFLETNGDPWGYEHVSVQERLDLSLKFISRWINQDFSGIFLEIGAFNGDFSKRLSEYFKGAQIIINDFSEIALTQAKKKLVTQKNVTFFKKNLIDIEKKDIESILAKAKDKRIVITLLEVLYYLPETERNHALARLIAEFDKPTIFISAPITGAPYFYEKELVKMFSLLKYKRKGLHVLNLSRQNKILPEQLLKSILNHFSPLRQKFANQTIYCFEPHNE